MSTDNVVTLQSLLTQTMEIFWNFFSCGLVQSVQFGYAIFEILPFKAIKAIELKGGLADAGG